MADAPAVTLVAVRTRKQRKSMRKIRLPSRLPSLVKLPGYLLLGSCCWLSACGNHDTPDARQYVSEHSHEIVSLLDAENSSDLLPVAAAIGNARIVQLGESSHGSASMTRLKMRLVRFLHEQRGFNVLAFESSFFACNRGLEASATMSAAALMRSCLMDGGYSTEMVQLFEYIRESRRTAHPLHLAGVDVQPSSESPALLAEFFRAASTRLAPQQQERLIGTVLAVHQLQVDGNRCYGWRDREACVRTRARHHELRTALLQQLPLADEFSGPGALLAGLVLQSYVHAVDWQLEKASSSGRLYEARDQGMAVNARNLVERLHPGKKLLLWAHNSHIAGDFPYAALRKDGESTMGMHLRQFFGQDLYTIGLFMLAGSQRDNSGAVTAVTAHRPDSLEGLFMHLPYVASFMALPGDDQPGAGDDWLHRSTVYKDWGRNEEEAYLARCFDAVLMIRNSEPSSRLAASDR
jgi:erythromycin esterase